jgi:hypothetical protein
MKNKWKRSIATTTVSMILIGLLLFLFGRTSKQQTSPPRGVRNVSIEIGLTPDGAVCRQRELVGYASYLPPYDPAKGVDLSTRAIVIRTDDSGNVLSRKDIGSGFMLPVSSGDDRSIFAVRIENPSTNNQIVHLLRSDDFGDSWQSIPTFDGFIGASFLSNRHGFGWTQSAIYATDDGGRSWGAKIDAGGWLYRSGNGAGPIIDNDGALWAIPDNGNVDLVRTKLIRVKDGVSSLVWTSTTSINGLAVVDGNILVAREENTVATLLAFSGDGVTGGGKIDIRTIAQFPGFNVWRLFAVRDVVVLVGSNAGWAPSSFLDHAAGYLQVSRNRGQSWESPIRIKSEFKTIPCISNDGTLWTFGNE